MEHRTLDAWRGLAAEVEARFKAGWIFRGVSDHDYRLVPSIGRPGARKHPDGHTLPYDADEEKKLLGQFQREFSASVPFTPRNNLEWMVAGQHYRMPTRLLDWSESMLVAAQFAVEAGGFKDGRPTDAAVYGMRAPDWTPPPEDPFDPRLTKVVLVRPPHLSPRITIQQSVMTLHPEPETPVEGDEIIKWTIPSSYCFKLKGILNFCGIHVASLFPDSTDSKAAHLGWLYKWSRLS